MGEETGYQIFLVEDDEVIAREISQFLTAWGLETKCAEDFSDVLAQFQEWKPQLVLMDISLPFHNGFYWCQEIRKQSEVPVVFLSSAADNMNIVMAMNMGGDDFIAKPFDRNVLLAKIQAILRRTYHYAAGVEQTEDSEHLRCKGAVLNLSNMTLEANGQKLDLTKNEFRMLQELMEKKGHCVSRDRLMERLWETDCYVDENTLTVNMTRLRRKLAGIGLEPFITTKKGVGYLLEDESRT
ncbi:MAG: response regulator transcription factor [Lachnospiraceae bacterium]|nr:response regulator transcription factor [Cuneatibacter sp.]MDD6455996.1 response regulator transcription factor [Lachnospiraceae bacterium]